MALKNPQPRIVFVTTGYPTHYRPDQCIFVHRSIKALTDTIQPEVIHFRALKPGRPVLEKRFWDGVSVTTVSCPQVPFGSFSHFNTQLMELFGKFLLRKSIAACDVLHGAEAYPSGFIAGKWALSENKPFSFNVIGSDLNYYLKRDYQKIGKHWLVNLQAVACNSNALKENMRMLMGELPNVVTIYRGIDTDSFSPEGSKTGPQASLPPVRFLFLGGFHTWDPQSSIFNIKGGHTLLDAWRTIDEQQIPASLAVGGPGMYGQQFHEWRRSLHRPERVFYLNTVDPAEIPNIIRAADVVIIPSTSEGLPNIAKEALACGRPVLGTNVGGIPEAVENGVSGRIVPPNRPDAIADEIRWFCTNQHRISEMGVSGRNRMVDLFSWEQYKQKMVQFFHTVVLSKPKGNLE